MQVPRLGLTSFLGSSSLGMTNVRSGKTCPKCKVPLGYTAFYRFVLGVAYLSAAFGSIVVGYRQYGRGWLLIGWPFAFIFGIGAILTVVSAFPPKLEPYSEGPTWIKLS